MASIPMPPRKKEPTEEATGPERRSTRICEMPATPPPGPATEPVKGVKKMDLEFSEWKLTKGTPAKKRNKADVTVEEAEDGEDERTKDVEGEEKPNKMAKPETKAAATAGVLSQLQAQVQALQGRPQSLQGRAQALHTKAWGRPWPHSQTKTIDKVEIDDGGDDNDNDNDIDSPLADKLHIPPTFTYLCLGGIRELKRTLGAFTDRANTDTLVILQDYIQLREALEGAIYTDKGIVVTGHPGIGKTTFLFYLLLHRLERRLPTAIQFNNKHYFIFDEQGAVVHPLAFADKRLEKCWALADSNRSVQQPCNAFLSKAKRIIQTAPPESTRWKEWIKQTMGCCIVADLPSVPEIVAITKELGLSSSSTFSLVHKWGPSIRNVILSLLWPSRCGEDPIKMELQGTVNAIWKSPSNIVDRSTVPYMPQGTTDSLIFLRRPPGHSTELTSGKLFIPTPHLITALESRRYLMTNKEYLQVFRELGSHGLTRTRVGWDHEVSMHKRLCMGGAALNIFRGATTTTRDIQPSTRLLDGTLDGLAQTGTSDSFYWIPSVARFSGVDGVLGDKNGHVYAIQAAIGDDYKLPMEGMKKLWRHFRPEVRSGRTWNYVVVTKTKEEADGHVKKFSEDLDELVVDQSRVHMEVWGCVIPSWSW